MDDPSEIAALRRRVDELERKLAFVMEALRLRYTDVPATLDGEVIELIKRSQLIEAIKLYREQTGLGLKEAKDAVDAIARRLKRGY
ncbi:50S ribosomal protein L7/L12 [Calidithermus terrae]|uniref:50S ribosomal protein L7/L12 n=1 Tax=Calidithermus terrae TaxID=1408545 RepID=A0A399EPE1_9DEIN|nr:ribosomal protein L7/L12 [Calidithermus terrae]RIH86497.1 50S ribosomal protein L7/L12 [Calidithermus terrae]